MLHPGPHQALAVWSYAVERSQAQAHFGRKREEGEAGGQAGHQRRAGGIREPTVSQSVVTGRGWQQQCSVWDQIHGLWLLVTLPPWVPTPWRAGGTAWCQVHWLLGVARPHAKVLERADSTQRTQTCFNKCPPGRARVPLTLHPHRFENGMWGPALCPGSPGLKGRQDYGTCPCRWFHWPLSSGVSSVFVSDLPAASGCRLPSLSLSLSLPSSSPSTT